jgi:hypothetical protein
VPAATSLITTASRVETLIASGLTRKGVSELIPLAVRSLGFTIDAGSWHFCYRIRRTQHGLLHDGFFHRCTILIRKGLIGGALAAGNIPVNCPAGLQCNG